MVTIFLIVLLFNSNLVRAWTVRQGRTTRNLTTSNKEGLPPANAMPPKRTVRHGKRTTRNLTTTSNEEGLPPAISMPLKTNYTRPGVEAAARLVSLGTEANCVGHWDRAAALYSTALKSKGGAKLVKLDKQRAALAKQWASTAKGSRSLSKAQLLDVVIPWKFAVGKPRNALKGKLNSNSDEAVVRATQRGFDAADELPPQGGAIEEEPEEFTSSLNEVCQLCGVGPATASAILSVYRPDFFAFMADEVIEALYEGKRGYTIKIYKDVNEKCAKIARELNEAADVDNWTPANVGEALWSVTALCASGDNEALLAKV